MYIIQYFRAQNALYEDFKKLTLLLWSTVCPKGGYARCSMDENKHTKIGTVSYFSSDFHVLVHPMT